MPVNHMHTSFISISTGCCITAVLKGTSWADLIGYNWNQLGHTFWLSSRGTSPLHQATLGKYQCLLSPKSLIKEPHLLVPSALATYPHALELWSVKFQWNYFWLFRCTPALIGRFHLALVSGSLHFFNAIHTCSASQQRSSIFLEFILKWEPGQENLLWQFNASTPSKLRGNLLGRPCCTQKLERKNDCCLVLNIGGHEKKNWTVANRADAKTRKPLCVHGDHKMSAVIKRYYGHYHTKLQLLFVSFSTYLLFSS